MPATAGVQKATGRPAPMTLEQLAVGKVVQDVEEIHARHGLVLTPQMLGDGTARDCALKGWLVGRELRAVECGAQTEDGRAVSRILVGDAREPLFVFPAIAGTSDAPTAEVWCVFGEQTGQLQRPAWKEGFRGLRLRFEGGDALAIRVAVSHPDATALTGVVLALEFTWLPKSRRVIWTPPGVIGRA